MPEEVLDKGFIAFEAEGRLLQELGLRLVASPEVALVELIKNAYDADSPTCSVHLEDDQDSLLVTDEGHGMTFDDFAVKWMRVATSSKLEHDFSPKYRRRLTGAKGIGRFAVRFLGDYLTLDSVAQDGKRNSKTRLVAVFNWLKLDETEDLTKTKVKYTLTKVPIETPEGTTLKISKLRSNTAFVNAKKLLNDVLRMTSPISGLEAGRFANSTSGGPNDPGFSVRLPGETETDDVNLAQVILNNYWARLTINLKEKHLEFSVYFSPTKKPRTLEIKVSSVISKGFVADIRYFPRRKGVFSGKEVDGRKAWHWVRENCGVAVVDHGFRIKPYGYPNDDWLRLDIGKAHSEREWRTEIAKKHFPVQESKRNAPAENPVLNMAYNFQLVGAVFVETKRVSTSDEETDLVPAMDREGLLDNEGARQLADFVRAGIEFLAHQDKAELDRLAEKHVEELTRTARAEIQGAIEHIKNSPALASIDKARIVKQYSVLSDRLEEQEAYSAQARRSLMTMSLLGVVAGFMTHESKAAVQDLEEAVTQVRTLSKKNPALARIADDLSQRLDNFRNFLDYARLFVKNVRTSKEQPLSASGQVRHILNNFSSFAHDRGIRITNDIANDVMTPPIPVTVYSGVLLNLYTNALKAVVAAEASVDCPHVCFRAWNEKKRHIVEVSDNGIGIPPELRKRIWDPLYTTTSDVGNPLGSGMGLGLSLIKQVAQEFGGSVSLVPNPPPEFTTCFRVEFPIHSEE